MVSKHGQTQISMFSAEEPPANPSAWQDSERAFAIRAAHSQEHFSKWLRDIAPAGFFGRTSPEFVQATTGEPLVPSSLAWANSGMGTRGQALMLNTSDWRSGASVCSLSQVLEAGSVPQRYFLTPRACAGILRRAEKRGKVLPEHLERALVAVAALRTNPEAAALLPTP